MSPTDVSFRIRPGFRKKPLNGHDLGGRVLLPPHIAQFVTFRVRGPNARCVAYAVQALCLAQKPQVWVMSFLVLVRPEKKAQLPILMTKI